MEKTRSQLYIRKHQQLGMAGLLLQLLLIIVWLTALRLLHLPLDDTQHTFIMVFLHWVTLYAGLILVSLPTVIAVYHHDRRHELTRQSFGAWARDYLKMRAMVFFAATVGIEWFYFTVIAWRDIWFLSYWPLTILYNFLLVAMLPQLLRFFFRVTDLAPGPLADHLRLLMQRAGLGARRLSVIHVGEKTPRANAMVAGLGPTRRILLTDTMLSDYSIDEIEAIIAHEIGHEIHHHVPKRLGMLALFHLIALGVIQIVLPWFTDHPDHPSAVPIIAVALWVGWFYASLVFGILTRDQEHEADLAGWALIPDVSAYISAMRKLTESNLFPGGYGGNTHPSLDQRIAAAEKYLAERSA